MEKNKNKEEEDIYNIAKNIQLLSEIIILSRNYVGNSSIILMQNMVISMFTRRL